MSIISSPASHTIELSPIETSESSTNQMTLSNGLDIKTTISTSNPPLTFDPQRTSPTINAASPDDRTSLSLSSSLSNDIMVPTNSRATGKYRLINFRIKSNLVFSTCLENLSSTPQSASETSILPTISSDSDRASTISDDQSTILHTVVETISSSTESSTSHQITVQTSDSTSLVDTSDTTSKVFNNETISSLEQTDQVSSNGATSVTSVLQSTAVQHPSTSSLSSITTADSVTSPLTDTLPTTILSSTFSSPITTRTSTNIDSSLNTFEDQSISITERLNEETRVSMISLDSTRTSTEISVSKKETNQPTSETNIDLSSIALTPSITVQDTAKQQSTIHSSTVPNAEIDSLSSESSQNAFITLSKIMHGTSAIAATVTYGDQSSAGTSILSNTTVPTVDSLMSTNPAVSGSQTNYLPPTHSNPTSTSMNLFTTVESVSQSIENLLESSPEDVVVTNPTTTTSESSIVSLMHSISNGIPSTSDIKFQDPMSSTQITITAEPLEFETSTERTSTVVSTLSTEISTTILSSIMTSTTPSYSALLVSNSFDNSLVTSSENTVYAESTTQNMINSISSSISDSFTSEMSLSTNSIKQSSQGNSDAETTSSYTTQSTSNVEVSLEQSISSKSSQSIDEQTTFYTMTPTLSITSSQQSNGFSEATTMSNGGTSLSSSLDTSSLPIVTATSSIPVAALSTSITLGSVIRVSDSSMSQDFSTVTKDRLSTFKILSSTYSLETTTDPYKNQEILSSSQTRSDSTTEKINYATKSISPSQMFTNDLSSLELSTKVISDTKTSSSETETSTLRDITSYSSTSLIELTKPTLTSSVGTPSLSDPIDSISSNRIQVVVSPTTVPQFPNSSLSSEAQQDFDTSITERSSELTTTPTDQTVSRQITEELGISPSSVPNLNTILEQSTTDNRLTSYVSSEDINEQSTSIISSQTSDTTGEPPTDVFKSSDNQLTVSTLINTQPTISSTSNMAVTVDSQKMSTTINPTSYDDRTSSSLSLSFSNDIMLTTNSKETGKYIMTHLIIKKKSHCRICVFREVIINIS
jgi:hypothetical protein